MRIYKTYKYRLKLTKGQQQKVDQWIHICRFIYNLSLETKINAWKSGRKYLSYFDLSGQLTELRKEIDWIKSAPRTVEEESLQRMDRAFKNFYRNSGFPKYRKRDFYNSITFKEFYKINDNIFQLPKLGNVKIYKDRTIYGNLKTATISKKNNKYYITIVTEQESAPLPFAHDSQMVGCDVGVAFLYSLSDGTQVENLRFTKQYERKLRIAQRSLSRKVKGSNNYYKQRLIVGKLHEKIANCRLDYLHKQSTSLIRNYSGVIVEDLRIKNMVKFGYLGKSISDVSWGKLFRQLEYKSLWYDRDFIKIDPKYTSQTCNSCGEIDKMSRISQSKFVCTSCGTEQNADLNAAKNILGKGIAFIRQRDAVSCA